jgi:GNAT superfamily N-acetyltransferase
MTEEEMLHPISKDDIRSAYNFNSQTPDNPIVKEFGLESSILSIGKREGNKEYVQYTYEIHNNSAEMVLTTPAARRLYSEEQLLYKDGTNDSRTGRIVYNFYFFLKSRYQRHGIGTIIYELEEKLYRKWHAIQIHLTAVRAGKIVWRKKGFILPYMEMLALETRYEEWCEENGIVYNKVMDIMNYPEEFLSSEAVDQISLFKELIYV